MGTLLTLRPSSTEIRWRCGDDRSGIVVTRGDRLTSGPVTIVAKSNEQRRFLENGKLSFTKPGENVVIQTTPCMDILLKVKQEKKELKCEKVWERTLKRKEITIIVEIENTLTTESTCILEYSAPGTLVSSDPP